MGERDPAPAAGDDLVMAYTAGETVDLGDLGKATVYPLAIQHILQRPKETTILFELVRQLRTQADAKLSLRALASAGPEALESLGALMLECTKMPPAWPKDGTALKLPHFLFAALLNAWVRQSFSGDESKDPWKQLMQALEMVSGARVAETSATRSSSSSAAATA